MRTVLDADQALRALRTVGCDYRPDLSVSDGAWVATCIGCRTPFALAITETGAQDGSPVLIGGRSCSSPPLAGILGSAVTIGCKQRCRPPAELAAILTTDPELLEARAAAARWQAFAERTTHSFRRYIEATSEAS